MKVDFKFIAHMLLNRLNLYGFAVTEAYERKGKVKLAFVPKDTLGWAFQQVGSV